MRSLIPTINVDLISTEQASCNHKLNPIMIIHNNRRRNDSQNVLSVFVEREIYTRWLSISNPENLWFAYIVNGFVATTMTSVANLGNGRPRAMFARYHNRPGR